jgi:hypothetical protein
LSGSVNFRRKQDPQLDARTRACRMHGQSWAACSKCLTPLGRHPLTFDCRGSWIIANEDCWEPLALRRSVEFGEKNQQTFRRLIMLRRKHRTCIRYRGDIHVDMRSCCEPGTVSFEYEALLARVCHECTLTLLSLKRSSNSTLKQTRFCQGVSGAQISSACMPHMCLAEMANP